MGRATAGALVLVAAVTALASPAGWAADWTVRPLLSLGIEGDTNRALTSPAISSGGLSMNVDTRFERDTERLNLTLRPYGQLERYSDPRISHTDEEGLDGTATWLETERSSLGLHALLQDASTLYSELTGTGVIHVGQRRRDEEADATWTHRQTERWTVQLGATYSSSGYHGGGGGTLSNYREALGTATESFAYSERLTLSLSAAAGNAHTGGAEQSTRFENVNAGFQWQPTERFSVQGSGGASRQTTGTLSSTNVVGALSVSYRTQLSAFTLSAQRAMQPTGFGVFTEVDQATASWTRAIAPELSLGSEIEVHRETSAFQSPFISFTFADHTYSEAHMQLSWRRTPAWSLGLQLLYDRSDSPSSAFNVIGLHAHGWQLSLQSVWAPLGASISR